MTEQSNSYDVIILGGGAAGLAASIYTGRSKLRTLILERGVLGGQVFNTTGIANYPGFPDDVDGPELADLMEKHARRFGAEIRMEEITGFAIDGWTSTVTKNKGAYTAPIIILATGADPRKLSIPGEQELSGRGVSYCATCDGPFFKDKKLIVVGGGDSALKEGLYLTKFASELVIVHRRQEFRGEKFYQEQVRSHEKIRLELDAVPTEVLSDEEGKKVVAAKIRNVKTGREKVEPCDGVFIFVGHIPNTAFLRDVLEMDEGGQLETNADMETAVDGLYAIGDVRAHSYRQVATAVGEGVTAAMAAEHKLTHLRAAGAV